MCALLRLGRYPDGFEPFIQLDRYNSCAKLGLDLSTIKYTCLWLNYPYDHDSCEQDGRRFYKHYFTPFYLLSGSPDRDRFTRVERPLNLVRGGRGSSWGAVSGLWTNPDRC